MLGLLRKKHVAACLAVAVFAAACGRVDDDPQTAAADTPETTDVAAQPLGDVFGDCDISPNTCNQGPAAEGGEIVWLLDQGLPERFNMHRFDGRSRSLMHVLAGILPHAGHDLPDGTWQFNTDLFDGEPRQINDSPQTFEFTFRPEAVWSDGTPISAEDVKWLWRHNAADPQKCGDCDAFGGFWPQVRDVVGSNNNKTVTITLRDGVSEPEWFRHIGPTYPAHWAGMDVSTAQGMAASSAYFATNVPNFSAGPYLIDTFDVNGDVVLVSNPLWYGQATPLDRVVLRPYPVEGDRGRAEAIAAFDSGRVDGGMFTTLNPDTDVALIRVDDASTRMLSGRQGQFEQVTLNASRLDRTLRQALFVALDRAAIRDTIFADVRPPLRPTVLFAKGDVRAADPFTALRAMGTGNVAGIRELLEISGYTNVNETGPLTAPDGIPVSPLTLPLNPNSPASRFALADLIADTFRKLGVAVDIIETEDANRMLFDGDFDVAVFAWSGSLGPLSMPLQFWQSESESNFGRYQNTEVDRLLSAMTNDTDFADALAKAKAAEAIVNDDAYMLPLFDFGPITFVDGSLVNVRHNPNSVFGALYNVGEWGVRAR